MNKIQYVKIPSGGYTVWVNDGNDVVGSIYPVGGSWAADSATRGRIVVAGGAPAMFSTRADAADALVRLAKEKP